MQAARLDWLLVLATGRAARAGQPCWSGRPPSHRADLTGGDPDAYLKKQLVNIAIGIVLAVMVAATDHRWVRILAPLVYVASIVGLVPGARDGHDHQRLPLLDRCWAACPIQPAEFAKLAVIIGMALLVAERTEGSLRARAGRPPSTCSAMLAIAARAGRC